jgi:hypothetical protein
MVPVRSRQAGGCPLWRTRPAASLAWRARISYMGSVVFSSARGGNSNDVKTVGCIVESWVVGTNHSRRQCVHCIMRG